MRVEPGAAGAGGAATLREAMRARAATLDPEAVRYWERSRRRFERSVDLAAARIARGGVGRVLDVGASYQTLMLRRLFPALPIETLGFEDRRFAPEPPTRHWEFDLNAVPERGRWPEFGGGFDLVLFFEVIEHLHTAPSQVLAFFHAILAPGGTLLLSTPNALWLKNRVKLLTGRHPFEMIREDRQNPGHFREYTPLEMRRLAATAGFTVERVELDCLYNFSGRKDRVYARLARWLGGNFCRDMMFVLRK